MCTFSAYLYLCIFLNFVDFVVPMGISPMGNSGRFPQGKPPATESHYPAVTNESASFRVSIYISLLSLTQQETSGKTTNDGLPSSQSSSLENEKTLTFQNWNSVREEAIHSHSDKFCISIVFLFYIHLSVCSFKIKGNTCRKCAHCFVSSKL